MNFTYYLVAYLALTVLASSLEPLMVHIDHFGPYLFLIFLSGPLILASSKILLPIYVVASAIHLGLVKLVFISKNKALTIAAIIAIVIFWIATGSIHLIGSNGI